MSFPRATVSILKVIDQLACPQIAVTAVTHSVASIRAPPSRAVQRSAQLDFTENKAQSRNGSDRILGIAGILGVQRPDLPRFAVIPRQSPIWPYPTGSRTGAIEFFLSRLSLGVESARNAEVGASSSKSEHGLSHSGKVRNVISTTRCNLSRLAPPVPWTAMPKRIVAM